MTLTFKWFDSLPLFLCYNFEFQREHRKVYRLYGLSMGSEEYSRFSSLTFIRWRNIGLLARSFTLKFGVLNLGAKEFLRLLGELLKLCKSFGSLESHL